ncbi:MAG: FAD-binding oxidoreductase, partial [Candidatus Margulisiibacteriota bacterium]
MLIKKDQDVILSYFSDKSNLQGGHAEAVYFPESVDDLLVLMKDANNNALPLTISGTGTGTTGGRIPFGGAVVAMEKFKGINNFSADKRTVEVLPGTTLAELDDFLRPLGYIYPPDPTEATAQLGATIANNSSGAQSYKFGATRNWVDGLKIVL